MSASEEKELVGRAACEVVREAVARSPDAFVLGLGTGTTAGAFVRALAPLRLDLTCVSTSSETAALAQALGLKVEEIQAGTRVDLVVDGADEITPDLDLIKGGGGALLREKLVWESAARRVVIADAAKRVERLGAFPLPVEVVDFAPAATVARIRDRLAGLGFRAPPRARLKDGAVFRTDQGNLIFDLDCGAIADPAALGAALKLITGVVEHGLFLGLADEALIAADGRVHRLRRPAPLPTSPVGASARATRDA